MTQAHLDRVSEGRPGPAMVTDAGLHQTFKEETALLWKKKISRDMILFQASNSRIWETLPCDT